MKRIEPIICNQIIELLKSNIPAKEIVKQAGCSRSLIYKIAHDENIKAEQGRINYLEKQKVRKQEYINKVVKYRRDGHSVKETMAHFGITKRRVMKLCEGHSFIDVYKEDREKEIKTIIERELPQFEYIETYTRNSPKWERRVVLKCKECGLVIERIYDRRLLTRKAPCKCKVEKEREEKAIQQTIERKIKEIEKLKEKEKRKAERLKEKELKEQSKKHNCPVCGEITNRNVYCSDRCQKRMYNRKKEIKRRSKVQAALVDNDITLEGLYHRDNGTCYICGKLCDKNDYYKDSGTIICGDLYPSVDHVVPLARGGEHAWANVKLAHRICNAIKGAK